MTAKQVSELAIYPVKSFAQINLMNSIVDQFGLQYDRRWMVVDEQGRFITQRQQSRMCLIKVELLFEDSLLDAIKLTAPQMPELQIKLPTEKPSITVTVWKDLCRAVDCGATVAQWLSDFLLVKCKLVYFDEHEIRQVDQTYAQKNDRTAFSDGFPILLIAQASLDFLNDKLEVDIPMQRFRPNLVVSGCSAFDEDKWKVIRIGELILRVVKPCSRCVIPSIDTSSGERGTEPLKTLQTFRKRDNKIYFGQNVIANSPGNLSVGTAVEILEYDN